MPFAVRGSLLATLALALAPVGLAGCGKDGGAAQVVSVPGPARKLAPVVAPGAVSVVTRNTTRLGGADAASDAAAVARAVYPGLTAASRPAAVVLVNERDWPAALAASVLAAAPSAAPILYSEGEALPAISRQTLEAMHPLGAGPLGGAQVIQIGNSAPLPSGYVTRTVPAGTPAATAAAIEQLALRIDGGRAPRQAIVLGEEATQAMVMPAAGLAAESGAPILFVSHGGVPAATARALAGLQRPSIYVIDADAVGRRTLAALSRFGRVTSIPSGAPAVPASTAAKAPSGAPSPSGAATPTAPAEATLAQAAVVNAIEVARFTDGTFGWGVKEPGHGLVFANLARPLDAPAGALLSATGDYAPLLLLASESGVPSALAHYLSDIQPAYSTPKFPAVRGAYNRGWLLGDERAISAVSQAEIDSMLEIVPRTQTSEETSVSQVE